MGSLGKQQALSDLRARITALENRPPLGEGGAALRLKAAEGFLAAAPGLLHEVFTPEERNAGAALGFSLGQSRALITAQRPAIFYMELVHEGQERGLPYGPGLIHFGFDPEHLTLVRTQTMAELLWAIEEALACRAVAAVIADIGGAPKILDFTVSRRLSLRAAGNGASLFLNRYGTGREASAAQLRWRVEPAVSRGRRYDSQSPGQPRWQVCLEKGLLSAEHKQEGSHWLLDWKNGFEPVERTAEHGQPPALVPAPLPGAQPAALGHRLLKTA